MRRSVLFSFAFVAMAFWCLVGSPAGGAAGARKKIDLRVLYVGHPQSARESDFADFLEKHFTKVGKGDLKEFKQEQAEGFDVVVLDYDGDGFKAPKPQIGPVYSRATVTVGVVGADIGGRLSLKTRYL